MTSVIAAVTAAAMVLTTVSAQAQEVKHSRQEDFGNTLNLGVGIGYYGYLDQSTPFIFGNYEFTVANNFTLAPFLGFASYRSVNRYAGYYYHETVIPAGAKGTYYFDKLLNASPDWDFYAAASLGFVYDRVVWDDGYSGSTSLARKINPLYLDLHVGAEYHFNKRLGMFLDLSTGVSTVGLAIHHK